MKILVTGGTGFIGTYLCAHLIQYGNEVTILARSGEGLKAPSPGISYLQGDCTQKGPWQDSIRDHDVIINLAGASIFSRWTEAYKRLTHRKPDQHHKESCGGNPRWFRQTDCALQRLWHRLLRFAMRTKSSPRNPPRAMIFLQGLPMNGKRKHSKQKNMAHGSLQPGSVSSWERMEGLSAR